MKQGTEEWLEARRSRVTGTDIGALLGVNPWKSEADVAAEKMGGPGVESTLRMRIGTALEDLIAREYEAETGYRLRRFPGLGRVPSGRSLHCRPAVSMRGAVGSLPSHGASRYTELSDPRCSALRIVSYGGRPSPREARRSLKTQQHALLDPSGSKSKGSIHSVASGRMDTIEPVMIVVVLCMTMA